MISNTTTLARKVNRCRQRRNTSIATISPSATIVIVQPEPIRSMVVATSVSHAVRNSAIWRRMAASTRSVTRRTSSETSAATIQTMTAPRATSQPVPVRPMLFGSGGGAPDGRRRRRPCLTVGGVKIPDVWGVAVVVVIDSVTRGPEPPAMQRPPSGAPRRDGQAAR
jgi:hypothetical protein